MAIDFSLGQTGNFAQALLGGYQAGRAIGQQKRTDAVLRGYQTDPDGAIAQAYGFDPELGDRLSERRTAMQTKEAMASVIDPSTGSVNQPALAQLWKINPKQAQGVAEFARTAAKDRLEQAAAHGEIKAQAANYLSQVPLADRHAALERIKPQLLARGFTEADLAQARLDDDSLAADVAFGMSLKEQLAAQQAKWMVIPEGGTIVNTRDPAALASFGKPQPTSASGPVQVQSQSDYANLPAGAQYIAPDGSIRRKGGAVSNGGGNFP